MTCIGIVLAGSVSPDQWINLLFEFGPCAFFVFMFFVGLHVAKQKAPTAEQQRVQNIAYSVVWMSIFVFAGLSTVVFFKVNFPSERCIHGYIRGLDDPEFFSTSDDIFLKKIVRASVSFDYEFRMVNPNKESRDVKLLFQSSPGDIHSSLYSIPLEHDFDQSGKVPVELQFDRTSKCLTLLQKSGGVKQVCPLELGTTASLGSAGVGGFFSLLPVVHAAMTPSIQTMDALVRALDANDPVIRENVRRQLVTNGAAGVPSLENALGDPASSTRLRFESVRTLNVLGGVNGASFPQGARCAVIQLSRNPDALVRGEAGRLLGRVGGGWRC